MNEPKAPEWQVHVQGVDVGLGLSASTVRHLSQFTACPVCCLQDWHGMVLHSVFDSTAEVFLIPMGPPAVHSMGSTGAQTNSTTQRAFGHLLSVRGTDTQHSQLAQTDGIDRWHKQMAPPVQTPATLASPLGNSQQAGQSGRAGPWARLPSARRACAA